MDPVQQLLVNHIDVWLSANVEKQSTRGRSKTDSSMIYGINKLRSLILQLAIRGKLTSQNLSDGSASSLIQAIQSEKIGNKASEKRLKGPTVIKKIPFDIPHSWEWIGLSEYCDLSMGQSPPSEAYNQSEVGVPFFQGKADFGDIYPIVRSWCTEPSKIAKEGDILLSVRAPVGPTNIAQYTCCIGRGLASLSPLAGASTKYLLYTMRAMSPSLEALATGTTFSAVSKKDLELFPIPIPPLTEQERIVSKVEDLMALCDELNSQSIASMNAHKVLTEEFLKLLLSSKNALEFKVNWSLISNSFEVLFSSADSIEALKLVILELAIIGKLVPQDFGEESADNLFARISKIKESLISAAKIKRINPTNSSEVIKRVFYELPTNWILSTLQDIYDVRDGTHDTPKYIVSGYPLVTSKNLYSGKLDFSDIKFISEEDHLKIKKRSEVNFGDVLFAMIGTIGNPVIVDSEEEFSIKNIALFKPYANECAEMKYLLIFLKHITAQVKDNAAGAVQSFVSLGMLRNYPFPLPPLAEQKRIVEKVDELFLMCDQLKSLMGNASELQRKIADVLVDQALA